MTAFFLLLVSPAQAWKLTGWVWSPEQMPIQFAMTDTLEDSLPQVISEQTGMYLQEEALTKSICNWHWSEQCDDLVSFDDFGWVQYDDAACADFRWDYLGATSGNEGTNRDGISKVYWDDPEDIIGSGTLAVTYTNRGSNLIKVVDGQSINDVGNSDIVFNDEVDFGSTADIDDGCATGETSVESVMTHELGHLFGLGHSCEQGEVCISDEFLTATMYWSAGPCDTSGASINADDVSGITALYGPYVQWQIPEDYSRSGSVPLDMCFELLAEDEYVDQIETVNWSFGDGNSSDEREPCHTFEEQGQFTVTARVTGTSDSCGEWEVNQTERAFVLVCDVPVPSFETQHVEGLRYQVVNTTDVSTYGCVDGITWEVFKGGNADGEPIQTVSAWSPQLDLPEEGQYTIRLTAQGPAGEAEFVMTDEYESARGEGSLFGCSTTGAAGGGVLGALALGLALLFRRRED